MIFFNYIPGMERLEDPLHDKKFVSTIKDYIRLRRHPTIEPSQPLIAGPDPYPIQQDVAPSYVHQIQLRPDPNQFYSNVNKVQEFYEPNKQQVLIPNYQEQIKAPQELGKNFNDQLDQKEVVADQVPTNVYYDAPKQVILPNYQEQIQTYQEPVKVIQEVSPVYQQPMQVMQEPIKVIQEPSPVYQQSIKTIQDYISQQFALPEPKISRQVFDTTKQFIVNPTYQDQNGRQVVDTTKKQLWIPTYTQFFDPNTAPQDVPQTTYDTQQQNVQVVQTQPIFQQQFVKPVNQVQDQLQIRPVQNYNSEPVKQYIQVPQQQYYGPESSNYYSQPVYKPVIMRNYNTDPANTYQYPTIVIREQPPRPTDIVLPSNYYRSNNEDSSPLASDDQTQNDLSKEIEDKTNDDIKESASNDEVVKVEPHLESFGKDQDTTEISNVEQTTNAENSKPVLQKSSIVKEPTQNQDVLSNLPLVELSADQESLNQVPQQTMMNNAPQTIQTQIPSITSEKISVNVPSILANQNIGQPLLQDQTTSKLQPELLETSVVEPAIPGQMSNFYVPVYDEQIKSYQIVDKPNIGKVLQVSARVDKPVQQITTSNTVTESVIENTGNVDDLPDIKIGEKLEEIVNSDALGTA